MNRFRQDVKDLVTKADYRNRARQLGKLLTDVHVTPLESAVYHSEYVMRHPGVPHLQSPSRHLSLIKFFHLDIIVFILLLNLISLYVLWRISKYFFSASSAGVKQTQNCIGNHWVHVIIRALAMFRS